MTERKKGRKCSECGAYIGHHPLCSKITGAEAKKQLVMYYDLWLAYELDRRQGKPPKNLQIYDMLREFHKNKLDELDYENLTDWQENALDALRGVLYLVEGVFCKQEGDKDDPRPIS